jgi:ABC-2 type transport system ATP-binding protein
MEAGPVIHCRKLTRYYGATCGVEDLDLTVEAGEVFGFLGPNGSGKTTTIRLLLDLIRPTRGQALLFGGPSTRPQTRGRIGYLPGELSLDGRMTGNQTLGFLAALGGLKPREAVTARTELCSRLGLSAEDLERRVREYSRGMKQKLGLVSAFEHQPDLLILDEPTTGLDPLVREVVFQLMAETKDRGATVFHSSHILSEVERTCSRVGVLRNGRLVSLLTVEDVREASIRRMEVHFEGEPPLEDLARAGAKVAEVRGYRIQLLVTGSIADLLDVLARHRVMHLSFPESGLEEAFKALYAQEEE